MKIRIVVAMLVLGMTSAVAVAQETPRALVDAYSALADAIIAIDKAEESFIRSLLDGHRHGATALFKGGRFEAAAAEAILFANEGDNAIAGIRKRLLDEGHHHHADDSGPQTTYEPGFVIVTRVAKARILELAPAIRGGDEAAFEEFLAIAGELVEGGQE